MIDNLLYKAEKPSVCPSVRIFLVERIFAVDARIHVKLARNEAPVFWEHEVCFYNVLTPAVRHLRRFECQGVDDSCRNFTYIPAANRSPDTIDNMSDRMKHNHLRKRRRRDRMEHAPACTIGQVLLLVIYKYMEFLMKIDPKCCFN